MIINEVDMRKNTQLIERTLMKSVDWRSNNNDNQLSWHEKAYSTNRKNSDEICGLKKVIIMTSNQVAQQLIFKYK